MRKTIALFTFSILVFTACKKELTRPSWNVDVSVPVLQTSMGLNNLIADSLLSSDVNGMVSLVFDQSVFQLNLDTLLNIPDTTVTDTFSIPPPFPSLNINPGQTIINIVESKRFDLNEVELSEVKIKSGSCLFYISSTITQPTIYEYTIVNATLSGTPFNFTINVPAGSPSNPSVVTGSFDFSGYDFDLRGDTGNEYNKYKTIINVSLSPIAPVTTVYNSDQVIVKNTFSNLRPSYAKGYFGTEQIDVPYEETVFSFLQNIIAGSIDLDLVDVTLDIINGIGIDATVKIDTLLSGNTRTGNEVLLNHSIIGNSININRAVDNNSVISETHYPVQLNNGNSNADVFLENLPDRMGYALSLAVNPLGNVSGHQDFLYDDKTFDVRVNATIPLNLISTNLTLIDTLLFTIDTEAADNVNNGVIHIFAENGFPLAAQLQLFLLDAGGNILDSLVAPNTILSAFTNASNIVTTPRDSRIDFTLNESQLDHLLNTQRVFMRAVFNTSSQTSFVPLFDSYRLDLKMTTELNYTIE